FAVLTTGETLVNDQLDTMDRELKMQLSQLQPKTSKTIEDSFNPLAESLQKQFEMIDKEIKVSLGQQLDQLKYLQEQIKKVLELADLRLEDTDEVDDEEDIAATANRIAKQPTTRIARIAAKQL